MPSAISNDRQAKALEISRQKKISYQILPNNKFRPITMNGTAIGVDEYDDPVEALEAGDKALKEGELRQQEVNIRRLFAALERGVYIPWPQPMEDGTLQWVVLKGGDRTLTSGPFGGLTAALVEIARLVDEPVPAEV